MICIYPQYRAWLCIMSYQTTIYFETVEGGRTSVVKNLSFLHRLRSRVDI